MEYGAGKMPVTAKERYAELGCVIVKLFPKLMQIILKEFINLRGLAGKFQMKDLRNAFTKSEVSLMEQLPNMNDFTVELCYKILRYENVMREPSCKWGNIPHDTEVEIGDDIQRIINTTNEVISKKCEDVSEVYYKEFLEKTKDLIKRLDGHLNQDTCLKMYETMSISDINHVDILQELALLQNIKVSQTVDTDDENRERYSRISYVITDTFPSILRDVIQLILPAGKMYQLYSKQHSSFFPHQQDKLQDLDLLNSYQSLDVALIYKLLRQFELIRPPTEGWGKFPDKGESVGDDVERIHHYRNQLAHRNNTNIGKTEFNEYFDHFRNIGHRMDTIFSQKTNYEMIIIDFKTCRIDKQMQIKYENALKELENVKLRIENTPIKFYWGDSFETSLTVLRSILHEKKSKGRQKVRVQIIFQTESDVPNCIDILNSIKDKINDVLSGIEFIVAEKGSIVLNVYIKLDRLETNKILQSTVASFLEQILKQVTFLSAESSDIYLILDEDEIFGKFEWNTPKSSAEQTYLHFDIEADSFETDDKMEKQLIQISDAISKQFNGSGSNTKRTATLLPISLENLSTTEEVFAGAQLHVEYNPPVTVTLRKQLKIKFVVHEKRSITGCIKAGDTLMFIDVSDNKSLICCNVDGTYLHEKIFPFQPFHITKVNNDAAVSCTYHNMILMLDIRTGGFRIMGRTSAHCGELSFHDGKLYTIINGIAIDVFDMTGNRLQTISSPTASPIGISVQKDRLICIDRTSIYCCSLDEKLMWKFQNEKYKSFNCVTTDDKGNVYATDDDTCSIVVVSKDGKLSREPVFDKRKTLSGIHYDKDESVLLACQADGTYFLFEVKHV